MRPAFLLWIETSSAAAIRASSHLGVFPAMVLHAIQANYRNRQLYSARRWNLSNLRSGIKGALQLTDIGQIAIALVPVQTITDDKSIGYGETHIVGIDRGHTF